MRNYTYPLGSRHCAEPRIRQEAARPVCSEGRRPAVWPRLHRLFQQGDPAMPSSLQGSRGRNRSIPAAPSSIPTSPRRSPTTPRMPAIVAWSRFAPRLMPGLPRHRNTTWGDGA